VSNKTRTEMLYARDTHPNEKSAMNI